MSKIGDAKSKVLGYISAIRTMLDNYPQPKLSDSMDALLNSNSPFAFLMNLLGICGVPQDELLNWISKILCGKEVISAWANKATEDVSERINEKIDDEKVGQGILDVIEEVVKVLLLTNVKNMFTCSINPLIPNDVLKYPDGRAIDSLNGSGIKIPLSTIDMFNVLYHSPTDKYGSALYFDTDYGSNEIWKSTDFNAFLWYVINRGTNVGSEKYKCIWDNRVRKRKQLSKNEILKKNFFNLVNGDGSFISIDKPIEKENNYNKMVYPNRPSDKKVVKKDNTKTQKKQYIIVEYNERDNTSISVPDVLTVYLNADRYRYLDKNDNFYLNKTVFEFNFDYIYSLKLFDSKVIVANVINSLLGIVNTATASLLDGKYSLQQKLIAGKVSEIVKGLMEGEDNVINDCFFAFSNDEYESLLRETDIKKLNQYEFGVINGEIKGNDARDILDKLNNIGNAATLQEVQTNISNVFESVISAVPAQNENVEISDKFTFGNNILMGLIQECVVQIVMQVLSPKVIMLFALNSYFMGDVTNGDFSKINIQSFLKGLSNLIVTLTKQIFDILMKELIQFLMDEIRPLLILIAEKLLLERVRFYINLLKRLYALLMMFINAFKTQTPTSIIDNVNYADIVPTQNEPPKNSC